MPTPTADPVFAMRGVTVTFGGLTALSDVDLEVAPGQVLGVIGPNGAGKTTLFNVACGFIRPDTGELSWQGRDVTGVRPHRLAGLGIARTLQGLGLFNGMTVLDNVVVGLDRAARAGFWSGLLALPRSSRDERRLRERAMATLEELGIAQYAGRYPGSLPYALRKRVALARALVGDPDLLMLDEPASGLSEEEMESLGALITSLRSRMSVMLVEHHMDLVMNVCDALVVLDFGRVIARGAPSEVRDDPAVLAAYLGVEVPGHGEGAR
ncbi:ABC transporter ATP-binding protein [Nocardioides sp. YIM 152588]|uniref:ABC transporter ATP-binding protein n=1 Tax=Nocardioides sp. YIM 152588 TaxID=3158259 RepID=UPI0032E48E60